MSTTPPLPETIVEPSLQAGAKLQLHLGSMTYLYDVMKVVCDPSGASQTVQVHVTETFDGETPT